MNQNIQAYILHIIQVLSRYIPQDIFYMYFVCPSEVNIGMIFD